MNCIKKFLAITFIFTATVAQTVFQPQTKEELQTAVNLWIDDNTTALSDYGEINTRCIANYGYKNLFYSKTTFNDNISSWNVSNVNNWDICLPELKTSTKIYLHGTFSPLQIWIRHLGGFKLNGDVSTWNTSMLPQLTECSHPVQILIKIYQIGTFQMLQPS